MAQNRGDGRKPAAIPADTAWREQADWYDRRHGEAGDDLHGQVVLPAVLRQLAAVPGQLVLDCCCGQGVLGRLLAAQGVRVLGVDASPGLIAAARQRAGPEEEYLEGDARQLAPLLAGRRCDHAAVVLALQDLDPIAPVLGGIASAVPVGGRLVIVLTHPCFRQVKRSSWGIDERAGVRYRRLDGYATPYAEKLRTHPGRDGDAASTISFHRPLEHYVNALGTAGFAVTGVEEMCSPRRGTAGTSAAAEERAAREFPVFLLLVAVRTGPLKP